MKITRRRGAEAGTQVVELALVMPILLLISLGVIDMAGLLRAAQVVNNSTREGARLAVLPENKGYTDPIVSRVTSYIGTENNVKCTGGPTVTVDQGVMLANGAGPLISASSVRATCSYKFLYLSRLSGGVIPSTVTIGGHATFKNLY